MMLKVYLIQIRSRRRIRDMEANGIPVSFEIVADDMPSAWAKFMDQQWRLPHGLKPANYGIRFDRTIKAGSVRHDA